MHYQPSPCAAPLLRPALSATPIALAAAAMVLALATPALHAQPTAAPTAAGEGKALSTVTVNASADASAQGLSPAYPGGQVARGARAGILGTRDAMDTPFSAISYTNELILDRHARSVGDVLQNDPTVRVARGFGNFQESYFIRGFLLDSDDTAFNGLYSLLPRQYIATIGVLGSGLYLWLRKGVQAASPSAHAADKSAGVFSGGALPASGAARSTEGAV